MLKLKADEKLKGLKKNLPILGEITIPEDCILEFPDEIIGMKIVEANVGFSLLEPKKSEEKIDNPAEIGNVVTTDEDSKKDVNEFLELSLSELIEMATSAGLPEKDWKKLSENKSKPVELMANYLNKKLNKK